MRYEFTKMQGTGNDFVVFDSFSRPLQLHSEQIKRIANRRLGIGCDQVLLLEPSDSADAFYRIYNADGGEVMQCGNGARCAAVYLWHKGLVQRHQIDMETGNSRLLLQKKDNDVAVNIGLPCFDPEKIPARLDGQKESHLLFVDGVRHRVSVVALGNPHAVLIVDDVDTAAVTKIGSAIQQLDVFPEGVNVGFMQVINPQSIRLRVYERGAAETLSCGSGACAAVLIGCIRRLLSVGTINVRLPGGMLAVSWDGEGHPVWLQGPAFTVFTGSIDL